MLIAVDTLLIEIFTYQYNNFCNNFY